MRHYRVAAILSAIPWAMCVFLTFRLGYEAPYWDQWWYLDIITKTFDGTWRVRDCWMTVNEHRAFFPALATVGLARLTHWNHDAELALILLLATVSYGLIVRMIFRSARITETTPRSWVLPVVALLFFSFSQWRVWIWGLHIMIAMGECAALACLFVLTRKEIALRDVLIAGGFAVAANYSFASGIVLWPVGLLLLLTSQDRERRWMFVILWILIGTCTMGLYFVGYESTSASGSMTQVIFHPVAYCVYVLGYLGGPLGSFSAGVAVGAGVCGLSHVANLLHELKKNGKLHDASLRPFWGLLAFGCAVGMLTGLKEYEEGVEQAISSRYLPWPTLFWIGIVCLYERLRGLQIVVPHQKRLRVAAGLLVILVVASSAEGAYRADESHDAFQIGYRELVREENSEELRWVYPEVDFVVTRRPILREYRLSLFR